MQVKGYRLLVIPDPVVEKTDWGFELNIDKEKSKINQMYGTVHQVGAECWPDQEPWCKPGDRVAWSKYAGKFIIDEAAGVEYIILNDQDILATL